MLNYYDYVKSHPEEYKQFSCRDLLFMICECPPDFTKSEDWSEHNSFAYLLSGKVIMHSRERSWDLQQGDTIFLKKGACAIEKTKHDSYCTLLFYVPDAYIRSFVRENSRQFSDIDLSIVSKSLVLPVDTNTVLAAFYDSVISYFMTGTQPAENLLELKFRELLLNIVTNPANKELTAYFYKLGLTDTGTDDLQDVMERNCLYNLQLHEYARLCHRSLSTFKRDFQTAYGIAPGRWLLEKRLDFAAGLLANSERTVLDIVVESGFKNITHFDRVFKKQFGSSPLQYRKRLSITAAYYS